MLSRFYRSYSISNWVYTSIILLMVTSQDSPNSKRIECNNTDLSFILTARNDGHAGNFLQRLRNTLDNLSRFPWSDYKKRVEIIVVSYNDPHDVPTLYSSLAFESNHWLDENAVIRFILVPSTYHETTENPLKIKMHQYRAKNIGMRRFKLSRISYIPS